MERKEVTSLVFDPTICIGCEFQKSDNLKIKEQFDLCQFAYNETKVNLEKITEDLTISHSEV